MIFKKIVVENYRVFFGKQDVELYAPYTDTNKNLVLVGGLNGAGKTSLLNAFHLLLYGGILLSEQEYKKVLSSALNNHHFNQGGRDCSLELHVEDKEPFLIRLKLYFNNQQEYTHSERMLISRGRVLHLTDNEFKRFIEKKIPSEVAPFFIFDGEKIQDLVEKQENGELKKAIQSIIALDFFKSTLNHMKSANEVIKDRTRKFVSLAAVDQTKKELDHSIDEKKELTDRLNKYKEQIGMLELQREAVRKIMTQKLTQNAGSKNELTSKLASLNKELEIVIKKVNDCKKEVPNFLVIPLINKLKTRLSVEQQNRNALTKQKTDFSKFEEFISELLKNLDEVNSDERLKGKLYAEAKNTWAKIYSLELEKIEENIELLHVNNLSPVEVVNILKYKNDVDTRIKTILDEKYSIEEKIEALTLKLKEAPTALDVTKEEKEIDSISTQIGALIAKRRSVEVKLKNKDEEITRLNRKYRDQLENSSKSTEIQSVLNFSEKSVKVMATFIEKVTNYKATQISNEFSSIIREIFRKEHDFQRIEFDPNEFVIKIYNEQGRIVRLADRSAGEKQLIALALIWALTKCANISLPFVIDTPLGRLDSVHRENLAKYYFPRLSKQVIILSTDTEVNDQYLDPLKENVFRKYRLEYDKSKKITEICEGYFA